MSDFESRLRESLARQAGRAPDGDRLAEQIIAAAQEPTPLRRGHEWRKWTFPALAAAAVAAVALTVAGISQFGPSASGPSGHRNTAANHTHLAGPSAHVTRPTQHSTGPSSTSGTTAGTGLTGVHVIDATFVSTQDGWLLARADSTTGASGPQTAMLRTTDGGRSWQSMAGPGANVPGVAGCAAPCVDHIRFASTSTGYAYGDGYYGSSAFFVTTDGGAHWTQEPSTHVLALETLDDNVIRIVPTQAGCDPPGCIYEAETADLDATSWQVHPLPYDGGTSAGAQLVRGVGGDAYVLVTGNPAGGAGTAFSTLYGSTDDGATWTKYGEPCMQRGGEVDSRAIAAGVDGRVAVTCVSRQAPQSAFVAVSTDHGAHFAPRGTLPWTSTDLLAGDPATVLLAAPSSGSRTAYRSVDGGQSWLPVSDIDLGGGAVWVGWESNTLGRVIPAGGRSIWTTTDAGRTWTQFRFS